MKSICGSKRAATHDEIQPFIDLVRAGKLFDVQKWIAEGQPINPPLPEPKKRKRPSPLQHAINSGFHSMVQVLLEAGVEIDQSESQQYICIKSNA